MEELKQFVGRLRLLVITKQRPWKEFASSFSVPARQALERRLYANSHYFRSNYMFIALCLSLYFLFTNWGLLFVSLVVGGGYMYLFHIRQLPLVVQGRIVNRKQKLIALAVVSVLLLWLFGAIMSFVWLAVLVTAAVLGHCMFRMPNHGGASGDSKQHSVFGGSDGEDALSGEDEEAGGPMYSSGPVPGTVETSERRNEDYQARRARMQRQYPSLQFDD